MVMSAHHPIVSHVIAEILRRQAIPITNLPTSAATVPPVTQPQPGNRPNSITIKQDLPLPAPTLISTANRAIAPDIPTQSTIATPAISSTSRRPQIPITLLTASATLVQAATIPPHGFRSIPADTTTHLPDSRWREPISASSVNRVTLPVMQTHHRSVTLVIPGILLKLTTLTMKRAILTIIA